LFLRALRRFRIASAVGQVANLPPIGNRRGPAVGNSLRIIVCGLPCCGAGCQPAADWQSAFSAGRLTIGRRLTTCPTSYFQQTVANWKITKGAALLEAALLVPILLALMIGTVQLGQLTYNYYMIQKMLSGLALYLGGQQGVNFCNGSDPIMIAAINNALTGSVDGSGTPIVAGLTPGMVQVSITRYDPNSQQLAPCDCSASGCDISQGGGPPGFITVSLTNGYTVRPLFWGFSVNPFPLLPSVTAPYAGS
jgi:hypothetical protein